MREKEGARGKESNGKPGRVLMELAVAEPENSGGKLDEVIGGTMGLEGAEIGGDGMVAVAMWVVGMPSLWLRGEEWEWPRGGGEFPRVVRWLVLVWWLGWEGVVRE